ncbi:ISAs1 family transposase, partial [Xenorhabdus nematophila]
SILDVVFKEDDSRIVLEGAIENLALFRRLVLNMVRQCDCGAPSQRNKLKKASGCDDYRAKVFFG